MTARVKPLDPKAMFWVTEPSIEADCSNERFTVPRGVVAEGTSEKLVNPGPELAFLRRWDGARWHLVELFEGQEFSSYFIGADQSLRIVQAGSPPPRPRTVSVNTLDDVRAVVSDVMLQLGCRDIAAPYGLSLAGELYRDGKHYVGFSMIAKRPLQDYRVVGSDLHWQRVAAVFGRLRRGPETSSRLTEMLYGKPKRSQGEPILDPQSDLVGTLWDVTYAGPEMTRRIDCRKGERVFILREDGENNAAVMDVFRGR